MQAVVHIYIEESQGPAQFIALGNLAVHRGNIRRRDIYSDKLAPLRQILMKQCQNGAHRAQELPQVF